jgi:hypothetical protein
MLERSDKMFQTSYDMQQVVRFFLEHLGSVHTQVSRVAHEVVKFLVAVLQAVNCCTYICKQVRILGIELSLHSFQEVIAYGLSGRQL